MPQGAMNGLASGAKTERQDVAHDTSRTENQTHRRRIISSPCRSKYGTNKFEPINTGIMKTKTYQMNRQSLNQLLASKSKVATRADYNLSGTFEDATSRQLKEFQ